ncbi:acyl-[acyl-carrier-protein] thioesterase [Williamsia serinedens]|uniref:Acyl-ACP thioesterase n=1 Tax=Williamsia serinedens TaxID=391736 RepID=A0ABT1H4G0_9NOCA|nr:acyl-ACP thioesterase domain-containing protein [Williamsia serinedens]MCP2162071.1 Acyl-ACP thioesterase [Williamsia serinedens]
MPLTDRLVDLPSEGYVFHTSWPLSSADIDQHERLSVDGVARYLQEAGAQHLVDAGAFEAHKFWIVRRTVVDVIRPITWPDTVQLWRWCAGISPRWCSMRVRITGDGIDGQPGGLIETEGFWINMNMETKSPGRMEDRFFEKLATTTDERRLRWKAWLSQQPTSDDGPVFALRHADTDRLDHVNNSIYLQALREVFPEAGALVEHPYRLVIEYDKPITYGETVRIVSEWFDHETGPGMLVWLTVDGDVRARASITPLAA